MMGLRVSPQISHRLVALMRLVFMVFVVAVLALVPVWASNGIQRLLVEVLKYLALAQLWNLMAGYAGLISIG